MADAQPCRPGRPRVFHQRVERRLYFSGMQLQGRWRGFPMGAEQRQRSEINRIHCGEPEGVQEERERTVTEAHPDAAFCRSNMGRRV
jgi:hypothetical protein